MTRTARLARVFLGALLALGALPGCLDVNWNPDDQDVPGGSDEDRDEALGIVCKASLAITGTFEEGAPQPPDVFGCWPVGLWTFTASVTENQCPDPPQLEAQYQVKVERDAEDNEIYTYMNDPSYERVRLKVTSGGGGLCEGGFEIYSPDGKILTNLKPALQADKTLNGFGDYEVYNEDQW